MAFHFPLEAILRLRRVQERAELLQEHDELADEVHGAREQSYPYSCSFS